MRNGKYYYLSDSLKIGNEVVVGYLFKRSNSKLHQFVKNEKVFLQRTVKIDFHTRTITFKSDTSKSQKLINPNTVNK